MNDVNMAIEIMGNRRSDTKLQIRLRNFLGDDLPEAFTGNDVPVWMTPYVAGGSTAEINFARAIEPTVGRAVLASYIQDDFTITNAAKVAIWRPKIVWPNGQQTRSWLVQDASRANGISKVGLAETMYGCSVQEYQEVLGGLAFSAAQVTRPQVADLSSWYERQSARQNQSRSAVAYYPAVMAVAAAAGVLYRYRANNPLTARFREEVAAPATAYIKETLGVEPLIVERDPLVNGQFNNLSALDARTAALFQKSPLSVKQETLVL